MHTTNNESDSHKIQKKCFESENKAVGCCFVRRSKIVS